jgi:hypothetical protein
MWTLADGRGAAIIARPIAADGPRGARSKTPAAAREGGCVAIGEMRQKGLEPSTSPLSGVCSSQLSY